MFSAQVKLGFESVPKRRHIWIIIALCLLVAALTGILVWIFTEPADEKAKDKSTPAPPTAPPTTVAPEVPTDGGPANDRPIADGSKKTRFQKFWDGLSTTKKVLLVIAITLGCIIILIAVLFVIRTLASKRPNYENIRLAAQGYVAENDVYDGNKKLSPGGLSNLSVEQFNAIAQRTADATLMSYATKAELEAKSFNSFAEKIGLEGVDGMRDLPRDLAAKTRTFFNEGLDKANRGLKQLTVLEGFHGQSGNTRDLVLEYQKTKSEQQTGKVGETEL